MDRIHDHALTGIERLEYELIVRDFVGVLNDGSDDELVAFLHPDVVYRASSTHAVAGRDSVIDLLQQVRVAFEEIQYCILNAAVSGHVVLVEQAIMTKPLRGQALWHLSFASFRIEQFRIAGWTQLQG